MEIEVLTTKKRLTKTVIKQLEPATLGDMEYFNSMPDCGYYVRDLSAKHSKRVFLFKGINGWVTRQQRGWSHKPGGVNFTLADSTGLYKGKINFRTREMMDNWLKAYYQMEKACLKNHLIL